MLMKFTGPLPFPKTHTKCAIQMDQNISWPNRYRKRFNQRLGPFIAQNSLLSHQSIFIVVIGNKVLIVWLIYLPTWFGSPSMWKNGLTFLAERDISIQKEKTRALSGGRKKVVSCMHTRSAEICVIWEWWCFGMRTSAQLNRSFKNEQRHQVVVHPSCCRHTWLLCWLVAFLR